MSDARPKTGIDLSLVQVLAGTGAALTAALLGSLFGIAGTLLGTALGSAVATICTAFYTYQLHRTRERLQRRSAAPLAALQPPSWRALPWLRVLVATVVVFGIALTALTVVESLAGGPLSSATGRSPERDRGGTSLGRALVPDAQRERPMPRDSSLPPRSAPSTQQSSPPPTQADVPPPPGGGQLPEQERAGAEPPQGAPWGRPSEPPASPTPSRSDATPTDSPSPPPSVDSATDQPTSSPLPSGGPP